MKVYRVLKVNKAGKLMLDASGHGGPSGFEVRHEVTHKLRWKPEKMLRKLWSFWW